MKSHLNNGILYGEVRRPINKNLEVQTYEAYKEIFNSIGDLNLYRIWNFVPDINVESNGSENYMQFNAGRRKASNDFYKGLLPAATGIDIHTKDLVIRYVAGPEEITNFENPEQMSPYDYPEKFGKISPSFPRGTSIGAFYYVSGTASIKGCETVNPFDIKGQLSVMIENLNIMRRQKPGFIPYSGIVYVRDSKDIPLTKEKLDLEYPGLKLQYMLANICRKDLLVEMELVLTNTS